MMFPLQTHQTAHTEMPQGNKVVSAGTPSRPSIRQHVRRIAEHPFWDWVGDAIGAVSIFVTLWILLALAEVLK